MRQRRLMNQINVVPYIDVMLVLLVIFMVTAPMIQTGNIDLPSVGKSAQPPSAPIEITVRADQSLTLRDRAEGGPERSVSREEMVRAIGAAQARDPHKPVVIAGDKSVKYESVLGVMDALQRANVQRIGLLVQPPR
ncbi:MAG: protein TolR [Betaproteobacteria bacterium]|nr:protein TolR [Betaproteobacteria bacterium]